ncbi:MAG TPA: hypothetical protein P5235_05350 [Saprospiraceae bacterium]|nr:hypothetical protein [Saprospiraceae bacterium]
MYKGSKLILLFSSIFLLSFSLTAQNQNLKKAFKQFELGRYDLAANTIEQDLQKYSDNSEVMSKLAYCYLQMNELKKSSNVYEQLILNGGASAADKFEYANVLRKMSRDNEARAIYESLATENPKLSVWGINCIAEASTIMDKDASYRVLLDKENSAKSDFAMTEINGGRVLSSFRNDILLPLNQAQKLNDEKSYMTYQIDNNGNYKPFWPEMSNGLNKGFISVDDKNGMMAYSETVFSMPGKLGDDIESSSIYFRNIKEIDDENSFSHNQAGVINAFPLLVDNGNTLIYSSNQKGGFGGLDLYISHNDHGVWSTPVNLGPEVNTAGNEISPQWYKDKLVFASDFLAGLGGYDLFEATRANDEFTQVSNLGKEVNTSGDEYFPTVVNNYLYFSSNRLGGYGSDDIYYAMPLVVEEEFSIVPPAELLQDATVNPSSSELPVMEVGDHTTISILSNQETNLSDESEFSLAGARLVAIGGLLPVTSVYFIQVAALYNNSGNNVQPFQSLSKYGNLYKIYKDNAVKIQLGYYYDEDQANQVLSSVRQSGYRDAFIVYGPLNTAQLELLLTSKQNNASTESSSQPESSHNFDVDKVIENNYKVRLASYEDPIWFDTKKVKDLGTIEQWSKGNWTIFILGGFSSFEKAKQAQLSAVNRGFLDAEIVIDRNGVLERMKKN